MAPVANAAAAGFCDDSALSGMSRPSNVPAGSIPADGGAKMKEMACDCSVDRTLDRTARPQRRTHSWLRRPPLRRIQERRRFARAFPRCVSHERRRRDDHRHRTPAAARSRFAADPDRAPAWYQKSRRWSGRRSRRSRSSRLRSCPVPGQPGAAVCHYPRWSSQPTSPASAKRFDAASRIAASSTFASGVYRGWRDSR